MSNRPENSEANSSGTSPIERLPFELVEAILAFLDGDTLRNTIWTATFLRSPSERHLYRRVTFSTTSVSWNAQACFLETIARNDRLAQHVIELVMGRNHFSCTGDARINRSIGQAMKKLVNLRQLSLYGSPYIVNADLDSVPFTLSYLVLSGERESDIDPDLPLLAILQAHPTLEELALDFSGLPRDLVSALKAEQEGAISEHDILCPNLKRFDGCDEGLRLFLPMRRIENVTSLGCGAEYINNVGEHLSLWLNPILKTSYQQIRTLEAWPEEDDFSWFFNPAITPYLTFLTHLLIFDSERGLAHHNYDLLIALEQFKALQSITLISAGATGIAMKDVQDAVRHVRGALPDLEEIFVGLGEDQEDMVYYRYAKGEGIKPDPVGRELACKPYTRWLRQDL